MTICSSCGSDRTYIRKDKKHEGYERWRRHPESGALICQRCFARERNLRAFNFKERKVFTSQLTRTGRCSWCTNNVFDGSTNATHLHHIRYHDDDPMRDTIEICNPCHGKLHSMRRRWFYDTECYSCGCTEPRGGWWYYNQGTTHKLCKYCNERFILAEHKRWYRKHYYRHQSSSGSSELVGVRFFSSRFNLNPTKSSIGLPRPH